MVRVSTTAVVTVVAEVAEVAEAVAATIAGPKQGAGTDMTNWRIVARHTQCATRTQRVRNKPKTLE